MSALLDRQFLQDIGVVVSESELQAFSDTYESILSDRVIESIVRALTPSQLKELHEYRARPDVDLQEWLRANVSELKEIIEFQLEILLEEIIDYGKKI